MWMDGLLIKLYHMGMKRKIFRTIKKFLTNRKIAISLGENLSENLTVDNGTPQRSIGPILFSVLINYIFYSICSSIGVSLFADGRAMVKRG